MTDASETRPDIEARLAALELLVAFLFAAQHTHTPDPEEALRQLHALLVDPDSSVRPADVSPATVRAAANHVLRLVLDLQERLPKRLID